MTIAAWPLAAMLIAARPAVARAEPGAPSGPGGASAFDLSWSAPPGCPEGSAVRTEVLRLAGGPARTGPRVRANVLIERRTASLWRLSLATEVGPTLGERTLSGQSCQAVADAAALTLAILLNPEVGAAPAASGSEQDAGGAGGPPAASQPDGGAAEPWRARGVAQAGLHLGVLPNPGPAFSLGVGTASGPLSVWLVANYGPEQAAEVQGRAGKGGDLWWAGATALGCWAFGAARWAGWGACVGVELDGLLGRGSGVSAPSDGAIFWPSGTLGLGARVSLSRRVAVHVTGMALAPLARPTLTLDGIGAVHNPGPLGGRIQAGLNFDLW